MWDSLIKAVGAILVIGLLVTFAYLMLTTLGNSTANCPSWSAYNITSQSCTNLTGTNTYGASQATSTANTIAGYFGTSSGGIASYLPLIITMTVIGGLLSYLGFKLFGGGEGRY